MPENKIATLGELWIGLPGMEVRAGRQLGGLEGLLAPLAALRLIGSSEELREQLEDLKKVALCNYNFPVPQLWTEENKKETEENLDRLCGRLNFCYQRARAAEKILAAEGWKFNPETRKAARSGEGHRGRDLLRECVRIIFVEKYQKEYPQLSLPKKQAVRKEISRELSPYFEAAELRPDTGALIDDVIRKVKSRPR